jgi:mitochondrial fission protein ELM1
MVAKGIITSIFQYIELAIERLSTGAPIAELAKQHNLSEAKVRRYIENAVLMARSRMYEKDVSNTEWTSHGGRSSALH